MNLLDIKGYAIAAAGGAVLAGALAGWGAWEWQANSYGEEISTLKLQHALVLKGVSDTATAAAEAALKKQQEDADTIAALDAKHLKELNDAKLENDQLRAAVDDGTKRLRIAIQRANIATSGDSVPEPSSATGVADAASAELAPSARAAYFSLRATIINNQAVISGLQEYITNVCLRRSEK